MIEDQNPSEKDVAYRMWLDQFSEKLSTKREFAFCQAAFSSGWDASQVYSLKGRQND